eukprot:COSAG05_NODE_302_length_11841_cov_253.738801_3_plen_86_part_00
MTPSTYALQSFLDEAASSFLNCFLTSGQFSLFLAPAAIALALLSMISSVSLDLALCLIFLLSFSGSVADVEMALRSCVEILPEPR